MLEGEMLLMQAEQKLRSLDVMRLQIVFTQHGVVLLAITTKGDSVLSGGALTIGEAFAQIVKRLEEGENDDTPRT